MSSLVVEAAGWTFVHFLWQGLAIGALYGIYLGTFRSRPQARYLGGCIALLLMVGVIAHTYHSQFKSLSKDAQVVVKPAPVIYHHAEITFSQCRSCHTLVEVIPDEPIEMEAIDPDSKMPSVFWWGVGVWLAGVSFLSVRLAVSQVIVQRLLRNHEGTPEPAIVSVLQKIRDQVGVKATVEIYLSGAVSIPVVIGWLRPTILLPATSVAGLSSLQLNAILAHELGHIQRRDYLVNFLQHLIEIALFFHPAVWFVSSTIRNEREFCCDEIAANTSRSAVEYARALVTLEQLRNEQPVLGMAVSGGSLLTRIKRLGGEDRPRSVSLLLSSLLILGAAISIPLSVIPSQASTADGPPRVEVLPLPSSEAEKGLRHLMAKAPEANLSYMEFTKLARFLNDSTLRSMIEEIEGEEDKGYSSWTRRALVTERDLRKTTGEGLSGIPFASCMQGALADDGQKLSQNE